MAKNNEKLNKELLEIVILDDTLLELAALKKLEKSYLKTEFYKETGIPLMEVYKLEKQKYLLKEEFIKGVFDEKNIPVVMDFIKKTLELLGGDEFAEIAINAFKMEDLQMGTDSLNNYLEMFSPLLKK